MCRWERLKDYAQTPKEVMGGEVGRGQQVPSEHSTGRQTQVDICHGFRAPAAVDRSHSPGAVIVKGRVWNEVKSWFLCFLAEAQQGTLNDRGP